MVPRSGSSSVCAPLARSAPTLPGSSLQIVASSASARAVSRTPRPTAKPSSAVPLHVYLIACLLVGLLGRRTWLGLLGFTILAFVVTPPLCALLLLLTTRRDGTPRERELAAELERVLAENERLRRRR